MPKRTASGLSNDLSHIMITSVGKGELVLCFPLVCKMSDSLRSLFAHALCVTCRLCDCCSRGHLLYNITFLSV